MKWLAEREAEALVAAARALMLKKDEAVSAAPDAVPGLVAEADKLHDELMRKALAFARREEFLREEALDADRDGGDS